MIYPVRKDFLENVSTLFETDGALAHLVPGYETRPVQIQMAQAISSSLSEKSHLLVEAGTGVG